MNLSYRLGWLCFRFMYATYFRWRVFNAERVPRTGPVILASKIDCSKREISTSERSPFGGKVERDQALS